jgi:uncharacterized protein YjbI with pentapeptide repeats
MQDGKPCNRDPYPDDPKGYCICHSENPDKNCREFAAEISQMRGRHNYDFTKFVFFHVEPFAQVTFGAPVYFRRARFHGGADFRGAHFKDDADFRGAQFEGIAEFNGAVFELDAHFAAHNWRDSDEFIPTTFLAAVFLDAAFKRGVVFAEAIFQGQVDFRCKVFGGEANFQGARFEYGADFSGTTFHGSALFGPSGGRGQMPAISTTFRMSADFSAVNFRGGADFTRAKFEGKADFGAAGLHGTGTLRPVTFKGPALFRVASFVSATFRGARFQDRADFHEATFLGAAEFQPAVGSLSDIERTTFAKEADFGGAVFEGTADFFLAEFEARADFVAVSFRRETTFQFTAFQGQAQFSLANFDDRADFGGARFKLEASFVGDGNNWVFSRESEANFGEINFEQPQEVAFRHAYLGKARFIGTDVSRASFTEVTWAQRLLWEPYCRPLLRRKDRLGKWLRRIYRRWRSWAKPRGRWAVWDELAAGQKDKRHGLISKLYRQLKYNYEEERDPITAGDFHFGEMEMRRLSDPVVNRLFLRLYRSISGYGEDYILPLFWISFFIFGFAALFFSGWLGLGLQTIPPSGERPQAVQAFWDHLLYSLTCLLPGVEKPFRPACVQGRWVSVAEGVIGPALIAMFVLALNRRFKR